MKAYPVIPHDGHIVHSGTRAPLFEQAGLLYRTDIPAEATNNAAAALLAGEGTMADVQVWGQTAWKTPHGSYASVTRFTRKSLEEHQEFRKALDDYLYRTTDSDAAALHAEALSELGDVVFSMTLLALNSSVELPQAVRQTLHEYQQTTHIADGQMVPAPWQPLAASIVAQEQATTRDIDALVAVGFKPELSTHVTTYDDEHPTEPTPEELSERAMWLIAHIAAAANDADSQFAYGGELDLNGALQINEAAYNGYARKIGRAIAQIYLEAAYLAHHGLDTTLTQTLQHTVGKISGRIATNTVDKADGSRG